MFRVLIVQRRRQLLEEKLRRKIEDNRALFDTTFRQIQPSRGAMTERRIVLLSEVRELKELHDDSSDAH